MVPHTLNLTDPLPCYMISRATIIQGALRYRGNVVCIYVCTCEVIPRPHVHHVHVRYW